MKKTVISLLSCILMSVLFTTASAQDYCKQIKKEVSDDKRSFDYASPMDPEAAFSIHVTRAINVDPDYPSDNFYIIFRLIGDLESIYTKNPDGTQVEKEEKKLVVEFEDKSMITDDTMQVSHDFTTDKLNAIRYVYYSVNEQTAKDFSTKKITKFSLAGYEHTYPGDAATAVMNYVKCIKDAKH